MLKSVGYGTGLQKNPKRVLEAQGFKQALADLGLTEELITTALVDDINNKEKNRIQELKLGAELLGMVKREELKESGNTVVYNFFNNEIIQAQVKEVEDKIKEELQK